MIIELAFQGGEIWNEDWLFQALKSPKYERINQVGWVSRCSTQPNIDRILRQETRFIASLRFIIFIKKP
ncbi:MAG: hypothetical protein RM022_013720 [Nostoc sp. EfeVER01]|nr:MULTISPECIES: hypothetical protein [unclassified Nostoc]MDZ7994153.1 hypothetical protein [Nostoc sp. EspVER01]